jgi:hypothetical protein
MAMSAMLLNKHFLDSVATPPRARPAAARQSAEQTESSINPLTWLFGAAATVNPAPTSWQIRTATPLSPSADFFLPR